MESPFNPDRLKRVGEYADRGGRVRKPPVSFPVWVKGIWDKAQAFRRPVRRVK